QVAQRDRDILDVLGAWLARHDLAGEGQGALEIAPPEAMQCGGLRRPDFMLRCRGKNLHLATRKAPVGIRLECRDQLFEGRRIGRGMHHPALSNSPPATKRDGSSLADHVSPGSISWKTADS